MIVLLGFGGGAVGYSSLITPRYQLSHSAIPLIKAVTDRLPRDVRQAKSARTLGRRSTLIPLR